MSRSTHAVVLSTALAGLLAGTLSACGAKPPNKASEPAPAMEATTEGAVAPAATAPASMAEAAQAATPVAHECRGLNDCKGQGGCKVDGQNSCKGTNPCKGLGGCKVS